MLGRYETGNLVATAGTEPVVVKGNNSISNVNWYYMYRNIKELAANDNVKTTMIWGSLWDRTLIWLAETNTASSGINGKSYADIVNSSTWGNYSTSSGGTGAKQVSGYSDTWKVNNIYDLAGNVEEWTLEGRQAYNRVARAGTSSDSGSNSTSTVSGRGNQTIAPDDAYGVTGVRSVLYVKP